MVTPDLANIRPIRVKNNYRFKTKQNKQQWKPTIQTKKQKTLLDYSFAKEEHNFKT